MKKLAYILAAVALVFSCAKEEINHPVEGQIPEASSYEPVITVDQETNQVTFTLDAAAVVPVWVFQDSEGGWTEFHTGNGYKKIYAAAGDYSVRMQVSNANGISPDYVQKTFHVNNTLVNFDKYYTILSKGQWHIDGNTEGHMACGETVSDPAGWWKAPKNDKAAFGVYDNRLTFTASGDYTFDPGTAGTVYVNIGVTVAPYVNAKGDATADYQAPAQQQTSKFKFEVNGEDLYMVMEPGVYFPYIPNDDFVTDTRFLVKEMAGKSVTLVWYTPTGNNGGPIAWQFILTNAEGGDEPPGGGDQGGYTYGPNLLGGLELNSTWFSPGDWSGGLEPNASYTGGTLTLTCPDGIGGSEWMGQVKLVAPIPADPEKQYAFFATIESSTDGTATVKLADANADAEHAFFYDNNAKLTAYTPLAYKQEPVTPDQAYEAVMVIFDFGRMAAGTQITVTGIELKEITGGSPGGGGSETTFDYNSDRNLWKAADAAHTYSQYYAPGWSPIANPAITNNGNTYSFTCPSATSDQWQNQFFIIPDAPIALSAEKTYDFQCKVELSQEVKQVTFKLTDTADDGNFLFTERRNIAAYEEFTFTLVGVAGIDAEAIKMVFDFGGNPDNTDVTIKEIILQEHVGEIPGGGGSDAAPFVYDDADNVWKAADAAHTYSQYYAPGWSPIANPAITNNGNEYSFTCPSATSDQWQNQFFIIPDAPIALSAEKTYDFQCKVELSQDVNQVTFKLTDTTDDGNFLFTERRNVAAYEEFTFTLTNCAGIDAAAVKMVFDFGGNPANTDVTIREIILREHK